MRKLSPKTAEQHPLAAVLIASVLLQASQKSGDQSQRQAGLDLIEAAKRSPEKIKIKPNSKMGKAIKAALKEKAKAPGEK